MKSERDFSGKIRNKKFQTNGSLQKGVKKLNRKIPTNGSRKESYDKKLEARRKRRAKGKVMMIMSELWSSRAQGASCDQVLCLGDLFINFIFVKAWQNRAPQIS